MERGKGNWARSGSMPGRSLWMLSKEAPQYLQVVADDCQATLQQLLPRPQCHERQNL